MDESPGTTQLPSELQTKYRELYRNMKSEVASVEGSETLFDTLLERYAFIYCALRDMEADWRGINLQRYNQLTEAWIKITQRLLEAYKDLYAKGAADEMVISKVVAVVADEVDDADTLRRIRARIANMIRD